MILLKILFALGCLITPAKGGSHDFDKISRSQLRGVRLSNNLKIKPIREVQAPGYAKLSTYFIPIQSYACENMIHLETDQGLPFDHHFIGFGSVWSVALSSHGRCKCIWYKFRPAECDHMNKFEANLRFTPEVIGNAYTFIGWDYTRLTRTDTDVDSSHLYAGKVVLIFLAQIQVVRYQRGVGDHC